MFFNQKNKWNLGVKSNFENFKFWVMPIAKFALVMTTVHNGEGQWNVTSAIDCDQIDLRKLSIILESFHG